MRSYPRHLAAGAEARSRPLAKRSVASWPTIKSFGSLRAKEEEEEVEEGEKEKGDQEEKEG